MTRGVDRRRLTLGAPCMHNCPPARSTRLDRQFRALTGVWLLAAFSLAACGGPGPTTPQPPPAAPPTPPPPATWTVAGRVVATTTNDGVGGVKLSSPPLETWTNGEGRFTFEGQGTRQWLPIVVEHPEFLTRATQLAWAPSRDN